MVLWVCAFGFFGCDGGKDDQAGVISTGNTARVIGTVAARTGGLVRTLKLATREGSSVRVVDSTRSDTAGRFQFQDIPSGTYWVEAWQGRHLIGASTEFVSDGRDVEIVVAIIDPIHLDLDLRNLGEVDSVFVDFPENPGRKLDSLWSVSLLRDSGSVLHAHVRQESGGAWTQWQIEVKDGKVQFLSLSNLKSLPFLRRMDTSVYSVDRHTVALWSFDEVLKDGAIADLGSGGHHLRSPSGVVLDSSPHGRALRVASLVEKEPLQTTGGPVPRGLRWDTKGQWTMQLRIRMDSIPRDGFHLAGLGGDPQLAITQGQAVAIYQHLVSPKTGKAFANLMLTRPGMVPVGKWVDLAISVDQVREEIYVWMDGQPLDLVAMGEQASGRMTFDSTQPFFVGGLPSDGRRGAVHIDEIRLSDTLVFGRGFPHQAALSWVVGDLAEIDAVSLLESPDGKDAFVSESYPLVGRSEDGRSLGRYLWKPEIPSILEGREIVFAMVYFFDADPPVTTARNFAIHEILRPWDPHDPKLVEWLEPGVFDDVRVARSPRSLAPLLPVAMSGGILFDVTTLVQKWVNHPASRNGILLRGENEDSKSGRWIEGTANPGSYYPLQNGAMREPSLIIQYR